MEIKASHPEAVPISGGTDVMVDLNFDRERPRYVLDLTRIPEPRAWGQDNGSLTNTDPGCWRHNASTASTHQ
ncbi:MAG: FAD binding domain-containing protein, partial [Rubrobacteraceae bacterium]